MVTTMTFPEFSDRVTPRAFYPAVVVDVIFERLAQGEPLLSICADPTMPSRRRVYDWLGNPGIKARYQTAVQQGALARALKSTTTKE